MQQLIDLIQLINQYLSAQLEPMSLIDFFIQYISPILQLLVIVGGAIAGLYKYFKTKNQEIYQQLLNEVYAPLFQYFVKQELLRKIAEIEGDYYEVPVLEYISIKEETDVISGETSSERTFLLGLNRQELIKVLENINMGLASKELYTLLSMYQVLVHLEEKYDKDSDVFVTATILKIKVENQLRKEVILGYKKYHDKLGIRGGTENEFLEIDKDRLIFKTDVTQEERDKLLAKQ